MTEVNKKLQAAVREIPDFPKPGILFRDITPVLKDPALCREIVEELFKLQGSTRIDAIVGIESRGFLFGMMLAQRFNVPFVTVRKAGKLPFKTISHEYLLEYGSAKVEVHLDAIEKGWNVLIHDDLLATGGTAVAAAELIRLLGGNVSGFCFLIELEFLEGNKKLHQYSDQVVSLMKC